jgi:hypothetical protein
VRKDVRQLFSWTHKVRDWSDEYKVRDDRFSYLAEVMGPGNMSFDEDDVFTNNDDEDLREDPASQIDLRVRVQSAALISLFLIRFLRSCRHMSPRLSARAWHAMGMDLGILLSSSVDIDNLDYHNRNLEVLYNYRDTLR